ncbi:MAG: class I SAM-dependent methyltransferase [Rhodocyclales bacterium]|nr:class I SAM-dependent methyltransferase [Rhodocyclales bacterium]
MVTPPDYVAVKQRQQATWASGDYAVIGTTLQIVGEALAEAADVRAGERVLDVAAGNGNASLAAARRFAEVTSVDYVPLLLEKAKHRAAAEGFEIRFQVEDAEALPFADGTFDTALSTFGAMFAPDQHQVARELMRVVRSGGCVAMANWTPEGFIGRLFRIIAGHVPPPAGVAPPSLWGTEPRIVELFGHAAADIRCTRRHFNFRYRSAAHWLDIFRRFYGPVFKVYGALDAAAQARLSDDITALLDELNVGGSDSLVVPSEYLEVVVRKQ